MAASGPPPSGPALVIDGGLEVRRAVLLYFLRDGEQRLSTQAFDSCKPEDHDSRDDEQDQ
jgi:hypothetical protein